MRYLWTEDTYAGLHFWELVNQIFFNNELVVESKGSNKGLLDVIFERLREVNNLVNVHKYNKFKNKKRHKLINKIFRRKEKQYKPLRFFYLLRDDVFVTKDRTKFFDYIIPIVPVLDGTNSYDQFIRHLKQGNILEKFDSTFLQRLALYIDDMRVLKNVYNEFLVYMIRFNCGRRRFLI